jgi:hypothetical protein
MAVVTATYQKFDSFTSWMSVWKIGGRESDREPCSQTPTYMSPEQEQESKQQQGCWQQQGSQQQQERQQEKAQLLQQQKRQQQQDLCGKTIKVAGKKTRNMAVKYECGSDIKNLVAVKGPQVAVVFLRMLVKACRDLATLCFVLVSRPESL